MTAKLKSQLEAARATLATALTASHAGDKQLAKLERDRVSIASQLEQLEAQAEQDPTDETSVTRLGTLREQQRLLSKKLATLQGERQRSVTDATRTELGNALSAAMNALIEWARPTLHTIATEATEAFRPFYRDETALELTVARCDKLLSFKAFIANVGDGPAHEKSKRALAILDALIAGNDCGWIWHGLDTPAAESPSEQAPEPTPPSASAKPARYPRQSRSVLA
jgi:hypothetical protein